MNGMGGYLPTSTARDRRFPDAVQRCQMSMGNDVPADGVEWSAALLISTNLGCWRCAHDWGRPEPSASHQVLQPTALGCAAVRRKRQEVQAVRRWGVLDRISIPHLRIVIPGEHLAKTRPQKIWSHRQQTTACRT